MQHDSKLHHSDPITDPELAQLSPQSATIRPSTRTDVPALKSIIDEVGLFPSEMLDDMMADYFNNQPGTDHFWLTDDDNGPVGVAYYAPERLTEGTWNLYLIAIHSDRQEQGRGAALLRYVEQALREQGERLLLVETSGLPNFEYQRAFYRKCGYDEEARIRDFYQAGEDKVVFRKALVVSTLSPA
ncbi:MAG: GNAT family N-acetyltransferase [Sphingobacteriaceae bacterium]|nr:GNAT family N-acetyltransferase [Cytophagaceae bacterium]